MMSTFRALSALISRSLLPYALSYFIKYAIFSISARSFIATTSREGSFTASLRNARPIRPAPFIATRVVLILCVLMFSN